MSVVEDGRRKTEGLVVKMAEIEGRGRALIASKPLKGGEIVLKETPILLYSALPLKQPPPQPSEQQLTGRSNYCYNCFKSIAVAAKNSSMISCPSCYSLFFCSPNCQSVALSSSHSPWVCQALSRLRDAPSNWQSLHHHHQAERQVQARFLVAAYNLAVVSPSDFRTLLSLQGNHSNGDDKDALFLHSLVSSLCPPPPPPIQHHAFSLELTAALLAKDKLNAFGLMEPFSFSQDQNGDRSVRAYGIYPKASFFNHDCLPNACRFEYLDNNDHPVIVNNNNTDMIVRAIHDIPQGREICLSYFPVNFNYSERQNRLREDYGFTCECDRCKVEANWSEDDNDNNENEDDDNEEAMDEDLVEEEYDRMADSEAEDGIEVKRDDDDFPHAYFFLRYMCNRKNCWGTLAPLPPSSNVMECNVCGNLRKDEHYDALD
ncbi:histone-lysine N-methyltransferase ASHR2 [Cornus florida]|uniref:histone-lysine N-methyltransferase ASHR2 n=1 Tax=Cornus florida TaxID=4283 RepID=UPI00289CDCA4|nr:histone-lysine N-methyltransferase ASHR2 [Cornus florida]